jgi:hypothetical protein
MCANPAVPTDNHAAANNRARTDPTARSYLCSGLNYDNGPTSADGSTRAPSATIADGDTGRHWWHRIEQCGNARPFRRMVRGLDCHRTSSTRDAISGCTITARPMSISADA